MSNPKAARVPRPSAWTEAKELREKIAARLGLFRASTPEMEPYLPEWLRNAHKLQKEFFEKYGYFPDSTADIAEDRRR